MLTFSAQRTLVFGVLGQPQSWCGTDSSPCPLCCLHFPGLLRMITTWLAQNTRTMLSHARDDGLRSRCWRSASVWGVKELLFQAFLSPSFLQPSAFLGL